MTTIQDAYQKIEDKKELYGKVLQGYYWLSNCSKPEVIDKEELSPQKMDDLLDDKTLPFIIEANFYCAAEKCSIQIKNIDGQHHLAKIDLKDLPPEHYHIQTYVTHDIMTDKNDYRYYEVVEAWQLKPDCLLDGLETFSPAWTAFKGFKQ